MGRASFTVGRRTDRARRQSARRSLVASGIVPTYDLYYGSQCGLLFEQATLDAGFRNTDRAWWPTEERSLHAEGAVYREGSTGAIYQLADGTLILAHIDADSIHLRVAGPSRQAAQNALAAFQGLYPASYVTTDGDSRVPITFWANSKFGPQPRLRRIEATRWEPIVGNYSAAVREELDALMAWDEPGIEGQLILWQGSPGTGKTWALRALASEWSRWAEFHYITDPDSFFVDDPSYMVNVLLSDSYQVMDVADGSVFEEQAEGKWRVLILEDTGELLSANAKEKYGQGLSRLLNVVDGMIGQGLRVLCLVTTNDELGELNEAVRRPGRCASQIVFGPLSAEEAQTWTGQPDAEPGTIAELYSTYGKADPVPAEFEPEDELVASLRAEFARPIQTHDDAIDEGIAWGEYHAGRGPKPVIAAAAPDPRAEIARVAEEHADKATGYGDAWWNESSRTVFWNAGDWTTEEECEEVGADFLAIDGIDAYEHEHEVGHPDGTDDWEQVWPAVSGDAALAEVVALAAEPLVLDADPSAIVAAVRERAENGALEQALAIVAATHRQTIEGIGAIVASASAHEGTSRGDELALRTLDVLERFATRPADPPPNVTVSIPERETHVHVPPQPRQEPPVVHIDMPEQAPAAAPHIEFVLPAAPAAPAPVIHVAAAEAAKPADIHVDVHVPQQHVEVVTAAAPPLRETPSSILVDFDAQGRKIYIPVHDDPEELEA